MLELVRDAQVLLLLLVLVLVVKMTEGEQDDCEMHLYIWKFFVRNSNRLF